MINTKRTQVRKKIALKQYFVLGVIGVFIVTTIFYTVQIATYGARLAAIEKEELSLQRQKKELIIKAAGADSLSGFVEKSEDLGFMTPEEVLYLAPEDSVARLP